MQKSFTPGVGLNRTGARTSPFDSAKAEAGAVELTYPTPGDGSAIAENRIFYMQDSESVGTIPVPATLKGMASTLEEKILGGSHAFLDKLGERLAFERTGTRLYEALISKYNASENKDSLPDLNRIEQFYIEELKHFHIIHDAITHLGADPTAMTPAADISGMAAQGLIQVIADPRTNFLQSLEIILQAELVDQAGWEILIELAEKVGLSELAIIFQEALDEETFHLTTVKQWVLELTLHERVDSGKVLKEKIKH